MPPARISLTLSRHSSLLFITYGRSSGLHPISSHSCCMYVRAVHSAFARPCKGVHRRTSLMSSSLLLQQCPAYLVHLTLIVFMMGGRWPYSWYFVGCWFVQNCSQYSCVVAVKLFLHTLFSIHVVHPYSSIDTTAAWKKLRFILLVRSDFHLTDSLLIAVHAFVSRVLMFFLGGDETLLPR